MRAIPRSSCPGEDGLPILFFEVHWDIIGGKLVEVCNEIFRTRHIPKEMSTGLIYMIPKGSSLSDDVKNWRPITLLNNVYKIFAKTLSKRLQELLPQIIHTSQTVLLRREVF